ncbi:MAG: leucine-rich repeat protein [Clostridia bacterium]|nr:leucine-rich repeat protein [Clostridia bacterium]
MRHSSLMLFLLILLSLFIVTGLAEDNTISYQIFPESPTNFDKVSIVLDRVYDRITVTRYENGRTNWSTSDYDTAQINLGILPFGNQYYTLEVTQNGVSYGPVTVEFAVTMAEPKNDSANFTYQVKNGYAVITGYTGSESSLVIPSMLDGYPVKELGDKAFYEKYGIVNIFIEEGIEIIGSYALYFNRELQYVHLPDSLREIRRAAFRYCSQLSEVIIPQNVRIIGSHAFESCSRLSSLSIPHGIETIAANTFNGCSQLREVSLPDGLTSIGDSAFQYTSLTSITLPASLLSLGKNAFAYTRQLTEIIIPDGITELAEGLFTGGGLRDITLPSTLLSIGENAFSGCDLSTLILPDALQFIGQHAFSGNSLSGVVVPASVTEIDGDLYEDLSLSQITVSADNEVYRLENNIFFNANTHTALHLFSSDSETFILPEGIQHLASGAGANLRISAVNLPNTLESIGDDCFNGNYNLQTLVIPDSVTSIGSAFRDCDSLVTVSLPATIEYLDEFAFDNCPNVTFTIRDDDISQVLSSFLALRESHVDPHIEVTVDRESAQTGDVVTWTISPIINTYDRLGFYVFIQNREQDYFRDYYFTDEDTFPVTISEVMRYSGTYTLRYTMYAPAYQYEDVCPVSVTGDEFTDSLQYTIEADRETAHGDEIVTWTVTPYGGQPDYEIHFKLSQQGPFDDFLSPFEEQVKISHGEPVTFSQQLLVGKENSQVWCNPTIDIFDSTGASVSGADVNGGISYADPVYVFPYAYGTAVEGEPCVGGEVVYTLTPSGSVGPYTNFTISFTANVDSVLLKQVTIPVVQENEPVSVTLSIPADDSDPSIPFYRDYFIIQSFTDALGYNWYYGPNGYAHGGIDPVSRLHTSIVPQVTNAIVGDTIRWDITSGRDIYDNTATYLLQESTEFLITPCLKEENGTLIELSDPVYMESHGETLSFSLQAPSAGTFVLNVLVRDNILPNGEAFIGGEVSVQSPFTASTTLHLPASLTVVQEEAFLDTAATSVVVPEGCIRIESKAFTGPNLLAVSLPESVNFIADDAIASGVTVWCVPGSYAASWAQDHGYRVVFQ